MENYVEILVLSASREFIQELNLDFPLAATAFIYVHPVWNISPKRMERLEQYFHLMREVFNDKDRQQDISTMSRNEEITGRFMKLVDEHCERHHNLDWYAGQLCLTTRYVANTVKETVGMTASSCIEHAITQRAQTLLYTTTHSIQEIADQLGFQNQSHFGTFFKRHTGLSPAAFRKEKE